MSKPQTSFPTSFVQCALTALMPMLLTGCLDWSGDVARYHQILDASQTTTRPIFNATSQLTLVRALQLANADNEAIASSGENYIQALAQKMAQAGTFLPTLSLAPSYSLTNTNAGTSYSTSVPLTATANGSLSNVSTLQSAEQTALQQAQLVLDERETVLLLVVESYYTAVKSERQAAVYENSVKLKAEKVRDQEARLNLGNARPLDLAQSQADLAGTHASLTQARTDAANARSALARLIGVPAVTAPLTDAYVPPADIPALEQWQQRAVISRQDLLAAARLVAAARLSLDAAIRQYFPSVTINFEYFLHTDPASAQNWTGALSANVPIFSALTIEAGIRKAWSVYRQAGLAESQTRRQVIDDVNQSFENLQNNRRRIQDLQTQVEAAQRACDLSQREYQLGAVSNLDRLTQEDALLTARLNLISESLSEKTSSLSLLRSAGQLGLIIHVND